MGLFSKKPETSDLPVGAVMPPTSRVAHPSTAPASASRPGAYGIEETIRLMRSLPVEQNLELVVRVVKNTLESVNVRLSTIIEEAVRKEQLISQQIATLRGEIAGHEAEIAKRRQMIDHLEQNLTETSKVKERLELAEASGAPAPPPAAPASFAAGPSAMAASPLPLPPSKHPPPPPFRPPQRTRPGGINEPKPDWLDAKFNAPDATSGAKASPFEASSGAKASPLANPFDTSGGTKASSPDPSVGTKASPPDGTLGTDDTKVMKVRGSDDDDPTGVPSL